MRRRSFPKREPVWYEDCQTEPKPVVVFALLIPNTFLHVMLPLFSQSPAKTPGIPAFIVPHRLAPGATTR